MYHVNGERTVLCTGWELVRAAGNPFITGQESSDAQLHLCHQTHRVGNVADFIALHVLLNIYMQLVGKNVETLWT